jgi:hypothetical protein
MRINTVNKSRKSPGRCCRCGRTIEAGEGYKWVQAYRSAKRCFCLGCELRASDTTSGRLGEVYAAQEGAQDSLAEWDGQSIDDLRSLLETLQEELERIRDDYQEAADNMGEHFEGSEQHTELESASEQLDDWASQVADCISELDDEDEDEEASEEERVEQRTKWLEERREAAENVINDNPI